MKTNRQSWCIGCSVEPEDAEEEISEGVKHLDEEVPPQAHIRRKVWQ